MRVNIFFFYPINDKINQHFFWFTSLTGTVQFSPAGMAYGTFLLSLLFHQMGTESCAFGTGIFSKFMKEVGHGGKEERHHQKATTYICCLGYNSHRNGSALEMSGKCVSRKCAVRSVSSSPVPAGLVSIAHQSKYNWLLVTLESSAVGWQTCPMSYRRLLS